MEIEWTAEQAAHVMTRSLRYGVGAIDLLLAWTDEAINDPNARTNPIDPAEPHKRRITGFSPGYGGHLVIVYLDIDGEYFGVTAYPARRRKS